MCLINFATTDIFFVLQFNLSLSVCIRSCIMDRTSRLHALMRTNENLDPSEALCKNKNAASLYKVNPSSLNSKLGKGIEVDSSNTKHADLGVLYHWNLD
jgi:hypothetical protein